MTGTQWGLILIMGMAMGSIVFLAVLTTKRDVVNNNRWDWCQVMWDKSKIPFEGRQDFMKECFENK